MALTSVDAAIEQCLKKCLPKGALDAVTGDTEGYIRCLVECLAGHLITDPIPKGQWRKTLEKEFPKAKELFDKLDAIRERWLNSKAIDIINKTKGGAKLKKVKDYPSELEGETVRKLIELSGGKDAELAKKAKKMLKLIKEAERLVEKGSQGNLKNMLPTFPELSEPWERINGLIEIEDVDGVLSSVERHLEDCPESSAVLLLSAILMEIADREIDPDVIEERLRQAFRSDRNNVRAALELASFLNNVMDDPESAVPIYRHALQVSSVQMQEVFVGLHDAIAPDSEAMRLVRDEAVAMFADLEHHIAPPPWMPFTAKSIYLVTDNERTVDRLTVPATPGNHEIFERNKIVIERSGGYVFAGPRSGSNCHGYTFDKGESEIAEEEVRDKILPDNYDKVGGDARDPAQVCDVIVYGKPIADHSGLIVEVNADGRPVTVISKWGPSGGVFAHPPEVGPYGADWEVHRRKPTGLSAEDRTEIDRLRQQYESEQAIDPSSKMAHLKAFQLCRAKNRMKRV